MLRIMPLLVDAVPYIMHKTKASRLIWSGNEVKQCDLKPISIRYKNNKKDVLTHYLPVG